jgi:ATP-dependent Lhr-like helicase
VLPDRFAAWFSRRGWTPRTHQLELIDKARDARSVLLIAPTGAGKTLAGFLPTLIELAPKEGDRALRPSRRLHTLYISPLKALAVDIARNLERPVAEMGLPIRVETRTGDTPQAKRRRQKSDPPDILLTTPEQVALLLASREAETLFAGLKRVVVDELHSFVTSKRGDLLSLGLAWLRRLAPGTQAVGLSATVRDPDELRRWLVAQDGTLAMADLVRAEGGARPELTILESAQRLPWAGHTARHAMREIYELIRRHRTTLVFVNTRMQAEFVFQELWRENEGGLAIALHHGSLDVSQRRRVEEAMAAGRLKAVVCTSTLDLGVDWGDIDLVINVGAPKGASRLMQRIGRANHRLDEPSRAVLVPTNRFEVLECRAAVDAAEAGAQDTPVARRGALDVLAQHVLGAACGQPFFAQALFEEVASAEPYRGLERRTFDDVLSFVASGGYALRSYERFAKIRQGKDGRWRISHPAAAQAYRLNVGTIVESEMLRVRLTRGGPAEPQRAVRPIAPYLPWFMDPASRGPPKRVAHEGMAARHGFGGRVLGEVEEYFAETLTIGDTFLFAGEVLRFEGIAEEDVLVTRAAGRSEPKIPAFAGGKFPLSTHLAARVRELLANPASWRALPEQVADWLHLQRRASLLPPADDLLVETFPRATRHYFVAYPFEGRLAHQTLGMLLTRRLERANARPLGFVANDYALAVWSLGDTSRLAMESLFDQDMLGDDLEEWLAESALMKRTFRTCAMISGLIERRLPGKEKSRRQVTMSTDLIYDVLRRHEPDHVLLRAARADAATGLLDIERLSSMLSRIRGRIIHKALDRISPLAVPIMLEIGREPVYGADTDAALAEAAQNLVAEAVGGGGGRG